MPPMSRSVIIDNSREGCASVAVNNNIKWHMPTVVDVCVGGICYFVLNIVRTIVDVTVVTSFEMPHWAGFYMQIHLCYRATEIPC